MAAFALVFTADLSLAQGPLTVSPMNLSFVTPAGVSQSQMISVSTSSGSVAFTVSATSSSGWLSVTTTGGLATTTPTTITALYPGVNLPNGIYNGAVTITPVNGAPIQIPATLNLGGSASFSASPASLNFNATVGGASSSQSVTLASSGAVSAYSVTSTMNTGAGWLQVSPANVNVGTSTPGTINVTVSPGSLPAATYTGSINVLPSGSGSAVLAIPVTLKVGATGSLSANPSQISVNFLPGSGQPSSQSVLLSSASNTLQAVNTTVSVASGSGWLSVSPASFTISSLIPINLTVTVNPAGLSPSIAYTGAVQVMAADGSIAIINVTASGAGTTSLSASPSPLGISIPAGNSGPVTQTLLVNLSSGSTSLSVQTTGLSWLSVSPASANITAGTPLSLAVTATPPAGIGSGLYSGTILLTPQTGTQISVPVNITVGATGAFSLSPSSLNFVDQVGGAFPTAQTVMITGTGNVQIPFTVNVTTNSGGSWLVVSPQNGSIAAAGSSPTSLIVQVNPSSLPIGSYTGSISVTSLGSPNVTQSIPVSLLVTNLPFLQVSNPNPSFSYQAASATQPAQQQIQVTSSSPSTANLQFTSTVTPGTGSNWLQVSPGTATTPSALNLSISPSVLATLSSSNVPYTSSVVVTSNSAANSPLTIPVSLMISGTVPVLTVTQSSLNFVYQTQHSPPAAQVITVSNAGAPLNFTVTTTTATCGNFLSATPSAGVTPGTIAVNVNTAGLSAGTCSGALTIAPPQGQGAPVTVAVALQVSDAPLLYVSPGAVGVIGQAGTIQNQTLSVTSTDFGAALGFNVTLNTNNGGGWLLVGPTSGTTPVNLTIGFQIAGLPPGVYTGGVTVSPTVGTQSPITVPISLTIQNPNTVTSTPSTLSFSQTASANPVPQTIQLAGPTGLSFSTSASTNSGGNWLSVSPTSGVTPGAIGVSVNPANLAPQSQPYTGFVTVTVPGASNSPLTIPVSFLVTVQSFGISPAQLNFTYQATLGSPAPQNLQVTSNFAGVPFNATVNSNPAGLFVLNAAFGNTPATLSISINPAILASLSTGVYGGTVTITSLGAAVAQTIPLSLTVQPPAVPVLGALVNSGNAQFGTVSPGELVTLYGSNIGPASGTGVQLINGLVSTNLANTMVTFDGIPAPLIYVSAGQINAIVPYQVNGRFVTNVVVQRAGVPSNSLQYTVAATNPAIFSANLSGSGPGAILNSNNSFNGANNPAPRGSVIQLFATGEGMLVPQPIDGSVTSSIGPAFPRPTGLVSVTIGGQPAQITYAGEAPGLVSGVLQVNAIIPAAIGSGPQQVVLAVGAASNAQQNITVAVQ